MPMLQLMYCSRPRLLATGQSQELASIVGSAVRHNDLNGITGCLCHNADWFLQIIEGSDAAVTETYGRIGQDKRHASLKTLLTRPIRNRSFPEWEMIALSLEQITPGLSTAPGAGVPITPDSTPPLQLLMWMMDKTDTLRMKR